MYKNIKEETSFLIILNYTSKYSIPGELFYVLYGLVKCLIESTIRQQQINNNSPGA